MATVNVSYLTEDAGMRELCRQYWEIDHTGAFVHAVKELSEKFGVPQSQVAKTVAACCSASSSDVACAMCGSPRLLRSRADLAQQSSRRRGWSTFTCTNCKEHQQAETKQAAERAAKLRSDAVRRELESRRGRGLSIDRMSFTSAVYLASLLRAGGAEDLSFINPHGHYVAQLSPNAEMDRQILDHLYSDCAICVHPGSRAESIVLEDGRFSGFYPLMTHWLLPLPETGPSPAKFQEELEAALTATQLPEQWNPESRILHREVALQECLQYLTVVLEEHGFNPRFGDKTRIVLQTALKTFSIGQVYNFIWRAARDAAAFYMREPSVTG